MSLKGKPAKGRKLRGGTLFAISVLLIGSATLRIGLEAGPAVAREALNLTADGEGTPESPPKQSNAPTDAELQALINALNDRERNLAEKERFIEDRMKALGIVQETVEERIAKLEAAEEKLSATLAMADVASEDDLTQLTSVYEKMKPKQAAALFEEMDPEFAAGFLSRMRPEVAASIMAGLSPMAAYTISVVLAGRNASVPTE